MKVRRGIIFLFILLFIFPIFPLSFDTTNVTNNALEIANNKIPSADVYVRNNSMQVKIAFIGWSSDITDTSKIDSYLEHSYTFSMSTNWTLKMNFDFEFIFMNDTIKSQIGSLLLNSSINGTNTGSKLNETALWAQRNDGIPRSVFLPQNGISINATTIENYFIDHPLIDPPTNGYTIYILNYSEWDSPDHEWEHWFTYDTKDPDSNRTVNWFRLEWDNALNPDVKYTYPGIGGNGRVYILDPSATQWYLRWGAIWWSNVYSYSDCPTYFFKDLDDIQRENNLYTISGQDKLASYLARWLNDLVGPLFAGQHNWDTPIVDSISVQTLILNGDSKTGHTPEELRWLTNPKRLLKPLNDALPFVNWSMHVQLGNVEDYPNIYNAINESKLSSSDPDFWLLDGNKLFNKLYLMRSQLFNLSQADLVITSIIVVRSKLTMVIPGLGNFTGLGGGGQTIILKSRDRYYMPDGVTPKSGISHVLIHETGHNLGLGHPWTYGHMAADFTDGAMGYFTTAVQYNSFYRDWLKRQYVNDYYGQVMHGLYLQRDLHGTGPYVDAIERQLQRINQSLTQCDEFFYNMNYTEAFRYAKQAYDQYIILTKMWNDFNAPVIKSIYTVPEHPKVSDGFTIYAEVTDNETEVEAVYVVLTTPEKTEFKILMDHVNDHWELYMPPNPENYTISFYILALDSMDNAVRSQTFTIEGVSNQGFSIPPIYLIGIIAVIAVVIIIGIKIKK